MADRAPSKFRQMPRPGQWVECNRVKYQVVDTDVFRFQDREGRERKVTRILLRDKDGTVFPLAVHRLRKHWRVLPSVRPLKRQPRWSSQKRRAA